MFIDGNNWYHALVDRGVQDRGRLDYRKISEKLLGPRTWAETRYYIGAMPQHVNPTSYANQRKFLAQLVGMDSRISVHLGRIEERPSVNPMAKELRAYLAGLAKRLDPTVYSDLMALAARGESPERSCLGCFVA